MEILKKTSLVVAFFTTFLWCTAQSQTQFASAFSKSYENEQNEKYSQAINDIKMVYVSKSYTCNVRLGWLHYLAKQYTESVKYYNLAIGIMPYAIEARFGCIKPLSALESWNQVQSQYIQILKIDPQNTVANYWLGVMYYNGKDYLNASKVLEKVVNLYPLDYDSTVMLGWTKLMLAKTADAKILFNQALILRPGDTSALEGLKMIK